MTVKISTDILIIGAGLAGLSLADHLASAGRDFQMIEARARIGGRVLSHVADTAGFDLGPTWFWEGQPRIAALIRRFDLPVFEQYAIGDFRYENTRGQVQQGRGTGSMQGSFRVEGGMHLLCQALATGVPEDRIHLNTGLVSCAQTATGAEVSTTTGLIIAARRVVFALPPRLVGDFTFDPPLPASTVQCLRDVPTWMAGQAKALALYSDPFWRTAGLSGDAMSHLGPMVEIHDASPAKSGPYALFGFLGVPPDARRDVEALKEKIRLQLQRLFGPDAGHPLEIIVKDWAQDAATATARDADPLYAHPRYSMPDALRDLWGGNLIFAGSEVAADFGGYLEGALEAAEVAASQIGKS